MKRRLYFCIAVMSNTSGTPTIWSGHGLFSSDDEARGAADRISRQQHPELILWKLSAQVVPDSAIKDAARELEAE